MMFSPADVNRHMFLLRKCEWHLYTCSCNSDVGWHVVRADGGVTCHWCGVTRCVMCDPLCHA
jgi:hypothetical protein